MALRNSSNDAKIKTDPASFRDNRGFVFWRDGRLLRQINQTGKQSYDDLMASGLYDELAEANLLIRHQELESPPAGAYKLIEPELVPFISYPYEWSFEQLRQAALATLKIHKLAISKNLGLRDANAYNIQFTAGRPCLIDTLSFQAYRPGEPWQAYRQFCQHFLAPLALAAYVDVDLIQLLRVHIDGIPLPLASKLLPRRSLFSPGLYMHLKLHGRLQTRHEDDAKKPGAISPKSVSKTAMMGLIDSLERTVKGLQLAKAKTQWGDYYRDTNYSSVATKSKQDFVATALAKIKPKQVIDLGSNDGTFSRLAKEAGLIISLDIDPLAVNYNFLQVQRNHETNLLPLLVDITNPSPAIGWDNQERASLLDRLSADVTMALALVHHLAIANNLPLEMIATTLAGLSEQLIIEFVPKSDSQVQRLLATREDIFPQYTEAGFETAFAKAYKIVDKAKVKDSDRIMYLMKRSRAQ